MDNAHMFKCSLMLVIFYMTYNEHRITASTPLLKLCMFAAMVYALNFDKFVMLQIGMIYCLNEIYINDSLSKENYVNNP